MLRVDRLRFCVFLATLRNFCEFYTEGRRSYLPPNPAIMSTLIAAVSKIKNMVLLWLAGLLSRKNLVISSKAVTVRAYRACTSLSTCRRTQTTLATRRVNKTKTPLFTGGIILKTPSGLNRRNSFRIQPPDSMPDQKLIREWQTSVAKHTHQHSGKLAKGRPR